MESHHVAGSRGFGRWGSAEFRRLPGHRKQGGWHIFPEEPGHSYIPSRSTDQLMEEENSRRSNFRLDGKYNRIYRDHGGSFGQRDWKGANSWEDGNGRPIDVCSNQRSVDGFPHTSGRHMFPDEPGHSYMRSRSADKLVEEENGRRSTFRGDGKYSRNYRDNRGSFGQRDWKGPNSWENSNGRPVDVVSNQRSIDGLPHATCRPVLVEDSSHCYMPSRSAEKLLEEDGGRRSTFRENGKYIRNYRDNKGSFGHRVWKGGDTWESSSGRPVDVSNSQRSLDELSHTSSRHEQVEESAHGYMPARLTDKLMEEDGGHRPTFRVDGKYNRNYRDNRGPFRQRYLKDGKSLENGNSKLIDASDEQKSVNVLPLTSVPQSEDGNACDSLPVDSKEHDAVSNDGNALSSSQKCEKDNSLPMMDWKPLKWSRSGSLSSRGSGLSHSSSSKSMGGMNSGEVKGGAVTKDVTPVTSPTGDAVNCVTSAAPVEELNSKKKPRLGWGEGLAKYEKKKVEGVDEVAPKLYESVHSAGGTSLASKIPIVTGVSDCASPATPSSVDYSYSPGVEDKSFPKNSSGHSEFSNICSSPGPGNRDLFEGFSLHLENMDASSIANLGFSIIEMLQSDDPLLVESGFMRSPALRKLFLWRSDVVRALEATEFEIDSLENGLRSLVNLSRGDDQHPELMSSLAETQDGPGKIANNLFKVSRPAPLEILDMDESPSPQDDGRVMQVQSTVKNEDYDSPGTATSKYIEQSFSAPHTCDETSQQLMDLDNVDVAVASGKGRRESDDLVITGGEEAEPSASKCDNRILETIGAESWMSKGKHFGQLKDSSTMMEDSVVSEFIFATNKETARRASEPFDKLLPDGDCKVYTSSTAGTDTLQIDPLILSKLATRKRCSRFRERVLALKYKAFCQLWKEDLHQLALRKCRAKSQKKCDSGLRVPLNGYRKHRSSVRLHIASPGNWSPTSAIEAVSCTSKMLTDSHVKIYRKNLTMPALILDDWEKAASRFVTTNGLIEDPCALEEERKMFNPWTIEERELFLDKLANFGKDFRKIASFLDHKTTADCVEFYYKNHKSDCFERTMSKLDSGKRGKFLSAKTYLKTSEKRCVREVNSIPLEVLGAASVIVSEFDNKTLDCDVRAVPLTGDGCNNSRFSHTDCGDDSSSYGAHASERDAVAADILAGIGCSLSSEAMSSCITTSIDPVEKGHRRMEFVVKRPLTPDLADKTEEETCSGESCGEMDPSDWTDEEKSAFVQAFSDYGKDFAIISRIVGTRSSDQCKVFFSKARKCLGLDLLHPKTSITGTSFSDDANEGDSDSEDACEVETSSAICNDRSGSRMDEDSQLPVADATVVESVASKCVNLRTDLNEMDMDTGMQQDAVGAKDVKITVADGRLLKTGNPPLTLPGLHQSEALPCMYADGLRDRVTAEGTIRQGVVPMTENAESKPTTSAAVDHNFASLVFHEGRKDSLQEEEAVVVSDTPTTAHSNSTLVVLRKASSSESSSCKASATTPGLGVGLISEPNRKGSFGGSLGGVLASSLLQERSLSTLQDCCIIPAALDKALLTTDLPGSTNVRRNGDHSMIASENSHSSSYERLRIQMSSQGIIAQDGMNRKNGVTRPDSFMAELPLLPPKSEQPNNVPPILDQSNSDKDQNKEKSSGSGDFKLFGQILSHPPANPKSESIENGVHQKVSSKSPTVLKPCGNRSEDRSLPLAKSDPISSMNLQNVPLRSYGFWDGSRIQTGLPSLPDSAILLAKYPAAFGNYPVSSAKLEHLQLQAHAKSSDCHANGLSAFTAREVANNGGIMDYMSLRSRKDVQVQPFTIDMKHQQRLDPCPDATRCSSFETIPILQQHQSMGGMIAMNVMGRGGVPCNVISDPVAAIKMHYAQSEQYVGQNVNVNVIREDESWRAKGT